MSGCSCFCEAYSCGWRLGKRESENPSDWAKSGHACRTRCLNDLCEAGVDAAITLRASMAKES